MTNLKKFPSAKAFMAWLKVKNGNENDVVGIAQESNSCPLANFFKETTGIQNRVDIGTDSFGIQDFYDFQSSKKVTPKYVEYPLPKWAISFVTQIDKNRHEYYDNQVTAETAMFTLKKVTKKKWEEV